MSIPTTTFAVVAIVIIFVPGFVFAVIRIWQRGFRADDKGIDGRIAQALVVSVIFDSIYLLTVYWWLPPEVLVSTGRIDVLDPKALGATIFLGAIAIPAAAAWMIYTPIRLRLRNQRPWASWPGRLLRFIAVKSPLKIDRKWLFTSVPTAWDEAAADSSTRYVRILLPDKRFVGGLYGEGSYVSTYPEPRDIFVREPWTLSNDGEFQSRIEGSLGMWLTVPDGAIVDWVDPYHQPVSEQSQTIITEDTEAKCPT